MKLITVLIVDDQIIARRGLRALLEDDVRVEVVGEAADGDEALSLVTALRPRVVLMDVKLPNRDGLAATRRILAEHPDTAVVMLSNYDDEALVLDAVRAGASGYLLKDISHQLLHHTIRAVASGGSLFTEQLLRRTFGRHDNGDDAWHVQAEGSGSAGEWSEREQAILALLAHGQTNKEIAVSLGLSEVAVKQQVKSLVTRLQATDRTHAVSIALRLGLIE